MERVKKYFKTAGDLQKSVIIFSIAYFMYINGSILLSFGEHRDAYIVDSGLLMVALWVTIGIWTLGFVSGYRNNQN